MPTKGKGKAKAKKRKARAKPRTHKTTRQLKSVDRHPWPYVEVRWIDATSESSWKSSDELPNTTPVLSRGWLVRQTKVCITLAASIASLDEKPEQVTDKLDCGEIITIPKGCIIPDGLIPLSVKRMNRPKKETQH